MLADIITFTTTFLTNFTNWFNSIATMLLGNDIIKLILALTIIGLVCSLFIDLINQIRKPKEKFVNHRYMSSLTESSYWSNSKKQRIAKQNGYNNWNEYVDSGHADDEW